MPRPRKNPLKLAFCKLCQKKRMHYSRRGRPFRCTVCHKQGMKAKNWYRTPEKARGYRLTEQGLSPVDWEKQLQIQGHVCAACKGPFTSNEPPVYDHNHKTNQFRGIIHGRCNSALGFAKDNPETLRKLADYLDAFAVSVFHYPSYSARK